ncbi:MAG: chemotaxis-specific protein-glutamate methyltransferase CheB [Lachnospiraceae bacterium]|nr:chemotaxis-specific protein-glutamate methyltransferase CheB [Lachnospiraceae bacterium]
MGEKKKVLVVDDSALMRRIMCDIINQDERFVVADRAVDGLEALDLLTKKTYDAVVLDVNMPKMNGIELLKELQKRKISARVMMASTDTREGAKVTLDSLELGALDFIHKPDSAADCRGDGFKTQFIDTLDAVTQSKSPVFGKTFVMEEIKTSKKVVELVARHTSNIRGNKIVALASSTGGPKALQQVIPRLPANLKAAVLVVQHMPAGFTQSLAERLNTLSEVEVSEAVEGETVKEGHVYIARGGKHMNAVTKANRTVIHYTDEPAREGVKPCANYMYESLTSSMYDEIVCVVLTGMGADGTKGIANLKAAKKTHVIAQNQETCAVYGMPKSVVTAGLTDQVVPLEQVAQEIILNVGVR